MSSADSSNSAQLAGDQIGNLYSVIDKDKVHGLNLSVPEDAKSVIKPWDEREDTEDFAESGVDDQMIIHIPFTRNVRVRSILLKLGRGEATPRHLRIYANYATIVDFADAESIRPHVSISLLENESSVIEYPLRVAAFANIHALSIFFSESSGGDVSRCYFIGFRGDSRDMFKEVDGKLIVPAANAADASLVDRVTERSGASQQTTAR